MKKFSKRRNKKTYSKSKSSQKDLLQAAVGNKIIVSKDGTILIK
jgi:hypothetical protein